MDSTGIINGFRKALQELLVPEIKVLQLELKHLNEKYSSLDKRIDLLHEEMTKRFDAVDKRFEAMQQQMDKRFLRLEKQFGEMRIIQEKILDKIDVDKRMTRIEAIVEQLMKKVA